ncbi:MAG: DinB family protein [Chloroflexi bacterium CFX4]|nr:DinB family protein [Chloroflexi bacterium CFX4]MDL1923844.1 DinB family protein [Chloroflexi bacterium CFX3]
MTTPHSKAELIEVLDEVGQGITGTVQALSPQAFERESDGEWSAAGYLQHLILSVKPLAKALALPAEQVQSLFGQPDHPSRDYAALATFYKARVNQVFPNGAPNPIAPNTYRFPDGITDKKAYLVQTWQEAHQRLLQALARWEEADLDAYQLPHPAMGLMTLREMLFFTHFHNALHWDDIQRVSG